MRRLLTEGSGLKSQRKKTAAGEFFEVMCFILRMLCNNHRIAKQEERVSPAVADVAYTSYLHFQSTTDPGENKVCHFVD